MCMYSDNVGLQRSDKEVRGWKVLEIVEGKNGEKVYVTPYQFMPVTQAMLEGAEPVVPKDNPLLTGNNMPINRGYIHIYGDVQLKDMAYIIERQCAYLFMDDTWITGGVIAQYDLPVYASPRVLGIALCECVIPAGVDYLHGESEISGAFHYVDSYAASSIRIKRITHEFTVENYGLNSITRIVGKLFEERKIE